MQSFKRPRKANVKQTSDWKARCSPENSVNMSEKQAKVVSFAGKKGTNSKRQKLRSGDFEKVDKAVFTWFISKRSQKIPEDV